MSQPNMAEQNVPNGIPPQLDRFKPQVQFNGVHSSNSSRDPSPAPRLGTIPQSQLPPGRPNIPASQLPPSRSPLTTVTQKIGFMSVGNPVTPNISPKFSTSTPNQPVTVQKPVTFGHNSAFSPISVPKAVNRTSVLENVPINNSGSDQSNIVGNQNDRVTSIKPNQFNLSPSQQNLNVQNSIRSLPQSSNPSQISQNPNPAFSHQNSTRSLPPSNNPPQFNQSPSPAFIQQNLNGPSVSQIQNASRLLPPSSTTSQFNQGPGLNLSQNINGAPVSQIPNRPLGVPPSSLSHPSQNQYGQINSSPQSHAASTPNLFQQPTNVLNSRPLLTTGSQPTLNQLPHQNLPPSSVSNQFSSTTNQSVNTQFPSTGPQATHNQYSGSTVPQFANNSVPQASFNQFPMPPSNIQNGPPKPIINQNYQNVNANNNQGLPQQRSAPPVQNYNALPQMQNPQLPPGPGYSPQGPLKNNLHNNRYPSGSQQQSVPQPTLNNQQSYQYPQQATYNSKPAYPTQPNQPYESVVQSGFGKFWGMENVDLLQHTNILPPTKIEAPRVNLGRDSLDAANCSPDILRCTVTKIPENNSLLQKSRLPLGVLIHPFKDLNHLPVIQCNVIVRCRTCRTYINPFVYFVDSKRWKCNLCYRINELPEEFQYDPVSKSYGDPSRRPEIKSSTIEYIAPAEYMLRPPQPAVYLFLLDISRFAVESGYLISVCNILLEELKNLPGDARTQIGFIAYDSALHFFSLAEGLSQPHEMTVLEIDDVFLPCPDNLLVNLKDRMEMVTDLLGQLPTRYNDSYDSDSALGAALQAGYKMMGATGGRITVFQAALPNVGPGALTAREDPSQRASVEVSHLNPANDFYKRLALECSGQQIAVDLFIVNSQYVDIATISGISRFSGGCIHHFPLFKASRTLQSESFEKCFRRYLNRKIGFEAVMRIRCTRGLAIHTFHGNFFVRSTDLLSLPNINPDAGFGMQVSIEESLSDVQSVCFQAALLYTSSKGERRIRVHTLCLPIATTLQDVIHSADQQCIVGLLSKMAVDRSMQSSLSDAREAFINVAIDILSSYKVSLNMGNGQSGLAAPNCLRLLPLYISALLKHSAFRTGTPTRLDDRVKAMMDMKSKPLCLLMQQIYPDLYPIHDLQSQEVVVNSEDETVPLPPRLQLSARCLDNAGAFLMDTGEHMVILVCPNVSRVFLNEALGIADYNSITDNLYELPILNNPHNQRLVNFVNYLNDEKPFAATLQIIRDNSPSRMVFLERLIEDRVENALSYHEFLQHLRTQVK